MHEDQIFGAANTLLPKLMKISISNTKFSRGFQKFLLNLGARINTQTLKQHRTAFYSSAIGVDESKEENLSLNESD